MSVCLSYLWRFWRRRSAVVGICLCSLFFIVAIQFSSSGLKSSKISNPEHFDQIFKSTQKRLQSEPIEIEQKVRFLPRKSIVKSLPPRQSEKSPKEAQYFVHSAPVSPEVKIKSHGFKEDIVVQPYGLDNTEYDNDKGAAAFNVAPVLPPVYRPLNPGSSFKSFSYADQQEKEPPFYLPQKRIVHFDLKGAPPKLDYFLRLLKWIKDAGANGVLIEYEDMFPFAGKLEVVAASNHYNLSDIRIILDTCQQLGLDVIPLIQTFGHMEFILKHQDFAHLRDTPEMPESICACHEKSFALLKDYIDQVVSLHPNSKYIHIGCDEVYHLGGCQQCQGLPRSHLFISHVSKVASYIKEAHKRTVIIWDDMLRGFMADEMQPLKDLVEPMVWVYAEDPYRFVPSYNWDRLAEVFPTAWTASAFKGADGPTSTVPIIQKRLTNTVNWLALMGAEEEKFSKGFRGIVLTGWQRYDHFAVLAEVLPAAMPSLAVTLLAASHGFFNETLKSELYKRLGCAEGGHPYDSFIDLQNDPFLWDKLSWCFFPGSQVFKLTRNLENVQVEVGNYLTKAQVEQGWVTDYNVRRSYSSPMRVDESLEEMSRVQFAVNSLVRYALNSLPEFFDDFTVAEWIEQKIYPMINELNKLKANANTLKKSKQWVRRPLPILQEIKELGVGITTTKKPIVVSEEHVYPINQSMDPLPEVSHNSEITVRPKRLIQAPDLYRHPPGSFQNEDHRP